MTERKRPAARRGFGAYIRECRDARGYAQDLIAERLHTSVSTVSNWENEITEPSPDQINGLALNLGLSPARLVQLMGVNLDVARSAFIPPALLDAILNLTPARQASLLELLAPPPSDAAPVQYRRRSRVAEDRAPASPPAPPADPPPSP